MYRALLAPSKASPKQPFYFIFFDATRHKHFACRFLMVR
jgi:hypothetical protein